MRCPLSALVLLAAGVLAPAASALAAPADAQAGPGPGSFGIRLVEAPVSERGDPRALQYIIDHVPPGAVIRRRIQVQNMSPAPARITLYPDAAKIRHGSFSGDAGRTVSELTTWIRASRHTLTLAPHIAARALVTIRVPRDASPGERYGVLWAQESARVRAGRRLAVMEVNRVGIRIYLSVGPGGPPPTNFVIGRLTALRVGGHPVLVARVRNTGGRAVDMTGHLRLRDGPGGISAGPFAVQYVATLAPGQTGQVRAVLPKRLPSGPWRAVLDLESGLTERRASATIEFPGGIRARGVAITGYLTAGTGVLVAAGLLTALGRRRARRNRQVAQAASDLPWV